MGFDYKNHYKELVDDITNILIKSIEAIPNCDKDTPPQTDNDNPTPVKYPKTRIKQPPLKLD